MILLTCIILLAACAVGGGVWAFLRTRGRFSTGTRVLIGLLPLAGATALAQSAGMLASSPALDWNACKLAPVVAMVRGDPEPYALYQDPANGVMTAWIYGPVPALLLLPSALASRPTSAILIGVLINAFVLLIPAAAVHLKLAGIRRHPCLAMTVLLVFVWRMLDHESLRRALLMINIDGPTIGLSLMAIGLLLFTYGVDEEAPLQPRAFDRRTLIRLGFFALSSGCAVLACWSKQSAVPFVFVMPIYLWLARGKRAAIEYSAVFLVLAAVVSVVFIASFGATNMKFHMLTLPASHGWQDENSNPVPAWTLRVLWLAVVRLTEDLLPTFGCIAFVLLVRWCLGGSVSSPPRGELVRSLRGWLAENPWVMFPAAAVAFVPASLLGYVKIGGYLNNFSLTHAMMAMTLSAVLIRAYKWFDGQPLAASARNVLVAGAATFVLWSVLAVLAMPGRAAAIHTQLATTFDNSQEEAYELSRAHPGVVYFPWNTLSTLLGEGRLYHFEWGIQDRLVGTEEFRPRAEQVVRHVPPKIRFVAFGPKHQSQISMALFPMATARVRLPELAGTWTVYAERGSTPSAP